MSGLAAAPFKLTDAEIASVISSNTVSAKLTDAGIAAVLSAATVGSKYADLPVGSVGAVASLKLTQAGLTSPTMDLVKAGSALNYADITPSGPSYNSKPSGTWKCLSVSQNGAVSAWQRIS